MSGTNVIRVRQRSDAAGGSYESAIYILDPHYRCAFAGINGSLITDYRFYDDHVSSAFGLIRAPEIRDNEPETFGVLNLNGATVIPFAYAEVEILQEHWALGIHVTPCAEADAVYTVYTDPKRYFRITDVDVYYIDGGQGTRVASLNSDEFSDMHAKGDYLNILNKSGDTVTTYDRGFRAVSTNADSIYDFGDFVPDRFYSYQDPITRLYGVQDAYGSIVLAAFADSIVSITDEMVSYSVYGADQKPKYGLVRLTGEQLLPAQFDWITTQEYRDDAGHTISTFGHMGYYTVRANGQYAFAVTGGAVTQSTPDETVSLFNLSCKRNGSGGTFEILAADGKVTVLDSSRSFISCIDNGNGLIYETNGKDGGYDLIDWHGNILMSDCSNYQMTSDGRYLAVQKAWNEPAELYEVIYLYDGAEPTGNGGRSALSGTAAPAPAATPEPAPDAPAEAVYDAETLRTLLTNTIDALKTIDLNERRDDVSSILEQEQALLAPVNPNAAAMIASAKTLVDSGVTDTDSVILLIQSAADLLAGQ